MNRVRFIKMHGAGNDYVYVDCFTRSSMDLFPDEQVGELARRMSDRHFGIGADGLVLMMPSNVADIRMRMFNADGTEAQMCGNAARCVAKYAYESGLCQHSAITLETLAGLRKLTVYPINGKVNSVSVDMGKPHVQIDEISIEDENKVFVAVNMGNPHAVVFTEHDLSTLPLTHLGPLWEHHPHFAEGTNVEFVNIINNKELRMRVWERGTGETLACGTGACAAVVAAYVSGQTGSNVTVYMPGGQLSIALDKDTDNVVLTGPVVEAFRGEYMI